MSSPPPASSNSANPRKRPSTPSAGPQQGGSNPKRPRMHPLRQTSFPTSVDNDTRAISVASDAGSVSGSFTGSLGGASAAAGEGAFGGKRARKKKADKDREDAASTRGMALDTKTRVGSVDIDGGSVRGGGGGAMGGAGADEADDEEEFYDEGGFLGGEEGPTDTEAEKKNLAILVDAFNPIQSARYDLFKRAKLRKETLRRIVNHALSQSVPASVVTTVNGFTKLFVGEIVEKARTVQAEWAESYDQASRAAFEAGEAAVQEVEVAIESSNPTETSDTPSIAGNGIKGEFSNGVGAVPDISSIPPHFSPSPNPYRRSPYPQTLAPPTLPQLRPPLGQPQLQQMPTAINNATKISRGSAAARPSWPQREFTASPNPHRGQLLPSHLREALRRYKRDGEGGNVGTSTLSQQHFGVKGTFTWGIGSGGQRLFR